MTSREYFRSLKIVFFALISGLLFFAVIAVILVQMGGFASGLKGMENIFLIIALIFVVSGVAGSILLFRNRLAALRDQTGLPEKMAGYRSALIVKYALLEGPVFLCLIFFLVTGKYELLGLAILVILFFFTMMPTIPKAISDLGLNYEERKAVQNPDAIIVGRN